MGINSKCVFRLAGSRTLAGGVLLLASLAGLGGAPRQAEGQSTTPPPPQTQPATAPVIGPDVKASTDADREALEKLILEQVKAMQQSSGAQTPPVPPAPPQTGSQAPAHATSQPAPGSQPAASKPGCGPSGPPTVDLTPPPPDQPQPKLVVKQTKVKVADVWAGKSAVWSFELANEGEAPLAIRLQGG